MLAALKTISKVLTVASTVQHGKEMYDEYKDKEKSIQIDEVYDFISKLDLIGLQHAIDTNDPKILIDAVEAIMNASKSMNSKAYFDEDTDDEPITFDQFVKGTHGVIFIDGNNKYVVTVDDENVSVNQRTKRVKYLSTKNRVLTMILP